MAGPNGTVDRAAADAAAVKAADDLAPLLRIERVTLSNGIVLKLRPVPPFVLSDAARRVPQPQIPQVWIESRQAHEDNPNDPGYLEALIEWRVLREEAGLTVGLLVGTSVESIPDGFHGPDADEWLDELEEAHRVTQEALGLAAPLISLHREGKARYLDWLRYYAIPDEEDIFRVTRILTSSAAISEEDVQQAVAAFRRGTRRLRNFTDSLERGDQDGDHGEPAAQVGGESLRGAGGGETQPDSVG